MERITARQRLEALEPEVIAKARINELKNFIEDNLSSAIFFHYDSAIELERVIYKSFVDNGWGDEEISVYSEKLCAKNEISFRVYWKPLNEVWYGVRVGILRKVCTFKDL